jgi:S-adenosylmethionine synthetase
VIKSGEIFDFRPSALITGLGLLNPKGWSYRDSAAYGHFGRSQFPWEKTDKVEVLRKAVGI